MRAGWTTAQVEDLGDRAKHIIEVDVMMMAQELLELTKPSTGAPKLHVPRKIGKAMKRCRANSVYTRKAIMAYETIATEGVVTENDLARLYDAIADLPLPDLPTQQAQIVSVESSLKTDWRDYNTSRSCNRRPQIMGRDSKGGD